MAHVTKQGTPPAQQWWWDITVVCTNCDPTTEYELEPGVDAVSHPDRLGKADAVVTYCPVCNLPGQTEQKSAKAKKPKA